VSWQSLVDVVWTNRVAVVTALILGAAWCVGEYIGRTSTFRQGAVKRPSAAKDRGTYPFIAIALAISMIVTVIVFFFQVGPMMPPWSIPIGAVITSSGIVLRVWALTTLGKFFTMPITIRDDHRLLTEGPYRWVRHPAYTAGILMAVGMPIVLGTWVGLLVTLTACLSAYVYRIRVEERVLAQHFGSEYADYSQRTWRLLPWVY
jgi:protein-S-isoprenylcysteine O-methyltransferase